MLIIAAWHKQKLHTALLSIDAQDISYSLPITIQSVGKLNNVTVTLNSERCACRRS